MSDKKLGLSGILTPIFEEHNICTTILSHEEKENLISLWKDKYITKEAYKNEILWHTFSFNEFAHLSEYNAISKFNELYFKDFVIFSTMNSNAIACCANLKFCDYSSLKAELSKSPYSFDLYISHINFNWTFVITHEDDFGPFFATIPPR